MSTNTSSGWIRGVLVGRLEVKTVKRLLIAVMCLVCAVVVEAPANSFDPAWGPFTEQEGRDSLSHITQFGGGTTRVTEAGALLLFGSGLIGLVGYRRMRRMQ